MKYSNVSVSGIVTQLLFCCFYIVFQYKDHIGISVIGSFYVFQLLRPIVFCSCICNSDSHQHDVLARPIAHFALIFNTVHAQVYLIKAFTHDVNCVIAE